jgi:hypothetical protein
MSTREGGQSPMYIDDRPSARLCDQLPGCGRKGSMSVAYQHLDLERLARVIAMGGSGHDGEALAALRQADRSIRAAGMTWHDVLLPGRLIEGLADEVQRLRAELTALRTAKAAETQ